MAASRPGALQLSVPWLVPGGEAPVLPDPPLLSFLGHPSPHHEGTLPCLKYPQIFLVQVKIIRDLAKHTYLIYFFRLIITDSKLHRQ